MYSWKHIRISHNAHPISTYSSNTYNIKWYICLLYLNSLDVLVLRRESSNFHTFITQTVLCIEEKANILSLKYLTYQLFSISALNLASLYTAAVLSLILNEMISENNNLCHKHYLLTVMIPSGI